MKKQGIHKNQKMGAIKVFYNQCQFFAHLKLHDISLVNICDIMLMPLPNMEGDWTPQMNIACEALLEHCFMIRVHIMDWFRAKNVDHNWWQLIESNIEDNDNPITKILKAYNGRNLFNSNITKVDADLIPLNLLYKTNLTCPSVGLTKVALEKKERDYNKNVNGISNVTTATVLNQDTDEDEDNPCSPTDITFVNYLPAYNYTTYGTFKPNSSHNSKMVNSKFMQYMKNNTQSTVNKKPSKKKKLKKEAVNYITSVSSTPNRSSNFISTKEFFNQNLEKDSSYMQKDLAHKCSGSAKLSTVAVTTQNGYVENIIKKSITKNANLLPNLSHKVIMNQEYQKQNYLSTLKNDSNLLTFQGTDSMKMNGLITQIPSHLRANNKITFISQDMDGVNRKVNHVTLEEKFDEKDIKTMSTKLKPSHICNSTISEDNKSISNLNKMAVESNKTKIYQIPLESKFVYRNGRRSIIKHTPNFQSSTPKSSDSSNNMQMVRYNKKNQNGVTKLTSVENTYLKLSETNVSLPTPSPSSSELSNGSSCEAQKKHHLPVVCIQKSSETPRIQQKPKFKHSIMDLLNDDVLCETLSFRRAENAEIYLNIKRTKNSTKQLNVVTTVTIPNFRQEMLNEFQQLNRFEIKERILHLQDVRTEILKVMNFAGDRDIEDTLESIKNLHRALEDVFESCNHESEEMKDVCNDQEILSNEWELECRKAGNEFRCATCNKIMKPKNYIPGFSKPAENDTIYCSCYKHYCQECCSYQGNVTRFLTHQNFHEEEKPYACPDCFRRFPSFKLLEEHTWSFCFHMLKKRVFCCKICQIDGFQDTESLARHFAIMHSTKKIACETCYMVLDTYSEYKRHCDKVHSTVLKLEPIRLIICKLGQCINRYEKYMMHLEKHYGIRKIIWLKCPFCSYYNIESKQFLTQFKLHFQVVHLNRLVEIIKPETLKDILPDNLSKCLFKEKESLIYDNERFIKQKHIDEKKCLDTNVSIIVNTRTMGSKDFDRVSKNIESSTVNSKSSILSTIENRVEDNVRSENADSSIFHPNIIKKDNLPKILDMRSIVNVLSKDQEGSSTIVNTEKMSVNIKKIKSNAATDKAKISVINDRSEETRNYPKESIQNDKKSLESDSIISENNGTKHVQTIITKLKQSNTTIREILKPTITDLNVATNVTRRPSLLETYLTTNNFNNVPNEIETHNNANLASITKSEQVTALLPTNDSNKSKDVRVLPHPPPLIRIPQYILEGRNYEEVKKIKKKIQTISENRKTNVKRPWRIALNGPTNSKGVHQDFLCHLCGDLINTAWPIISHHFNTRHSDECKLSILTPRLLRITPEFINGGYKELFSNKKRKSDVTVPIPKKKKRYSTKKHTDSSTLGLCVEQESVEDGEGNFICRKCDQRCKNMSDLREHIASNHRMKGRYLVCLECGENFVVAPSLQMHLKAFHGIEDPTSYMNQNSSYAPDIIIDIVNETKTTVANQCYVCMAVFEDKAAVDKHLRVHGMAFLNRKRIEAQIALKNSDKNMKGNDDKQSFQKESTKEPVKRDNPSNTILEKINVSNIYFYNSKYFELI